MCRRCRTTDDFYTKKQHNWVASPRMDWKLGDQLESIIILPTNKNLNPEFQTAVSMIFETTLGAHS